MVQRIIRYQFIFISILITCTAFADNIKVKTPVTASSIQAALNSAGAGDTVIVPAGTYSNIGSLKASNSGSSGNVITFMAATPGDVTFKGKFELTVGGGYWVIKDFIFDGIATGSYGKVVNVNGADHVRVTNNKFLKCGYADGRGYIVDIQNNANDNRVDHNLFDDIMGIAILVYSSNSSKNLRTQIDHNYIRNIREFEADGVTKTPDDWSAIFIGGDVAYKDYDLYSVVEYNILENDHGDVETICNKSSSNTYRYNVFKNSHQLSIRTGDDNVVTHNYFIGTNSSIVSQGICMYGKGHTISDNIFKDLSGNYALYFRNGQDSPGRDPANHIMVENNKVLNVQGKAIYLGYDGDNYPLAINNITFKYNAFQAAPKASVLIKKAGPVDEKSVTWTDTYIDKSSATDAFSGFATEPTYKTLAAYQSSLSTSMPVQESEVGPMWGAASGVQQLDAPVLQIVGLPNSN